MLHLKRRTSESINRSLRWLLSAWIPVYMCSCAGGLAPPPGDAPSGSTLPGSGVGDSVAIGLPGDPATLLITDNNTGDVTTFTIHEDTDDQVLVMSSNDMDGAELRIRLDRAELENLAVQDLPGDFVALHHVIDGEDHPGTVSLLQSTGPTGITTFNCTYEDPERQISFDFVAVVDGQKSDVQSQVAVGTVIIVVTSIAAVVCLAELLISVLTTDCNQNCAQTCGAGNVQSCKLDVNFGVQRSPFKIGCFTSCETTCK